METSLKDIINKNINLYYHSPITYNNIYMITDNINNDLSLYVLQILNKFNLEYKNKDITLEVKVANFKDIKETRELKFDLILNNKQLKFLSNEYLTNNDLMVHLLLNI